MEVAITSIGVANPKHKQEQQYVAELVAETLALKPAERRLLKSVYKSTGIEYRHSVIGDFCKKPGEYEFFPNDPNLPFPTTADRMRVYKDNALKLALTAIRNCIKNVDKKSITHVITVSCTGMYAPGLDIEIVSALKLSSDVKRTAVNFMGCYGVFNAIKLAHSICRADSDAKVLVVSVELCTIHFQKNDSLDSLISNSVFADGAAAALVECNPRRKKYLAIDAFHCDLLPKSSSEMTWQIADSGFDIVLSSYIPKAIESGIADFAKRMLRDNHLTLLDVDLYAIHPGGNKILKACETALAISEADNRYAYDVLKNYGNMSSATVLFVLKAIFDDIKEENISQKIFSCAFGPGLTMEAMLLRVGG